MPTPRSAGAREKTFYPGTNTHPQEGKRLRIRASDLAAVFEVYMLGVVLGSVKTAADSTAPWYTPTATFWMYGATFLGGLILLAVLVLAALFLIRTKEPEYVFQAAASEGATAAPDRYVVDDEQVEDLLDSLEHVAGLSKNPKGTTAAVVAKTGTKVPPTVMRPKIRRRGRSVLVTLLGPSISAAVFAGISAALLPAGDAGGFLATSFQLNTLFILSLSYGWIGLIAYAVVSLFAAASEG
jgi:hypothetical protein